MRSPTEKVVSGASADRRKAERRGAGTKGLTGDRRVVEQRGMAHAMVDALEDILKYERASERALRVSESRGAGSPDASN